MYVYFFLFVEKSYHKGIKPPDEFKITFYILMPDMAIFRMALTASSPLFVPANQTWSVILQNGQGGWRTAQNRERSDARKPLLLDRGAQMPR